MAPAPRLSCPSNPSSSPVSASVPSVRPEIGASSSPRTASAGAWAARSAAAIPSRFAKSRAAETGLVGFHCQTRLRGLCAIQKRHAKVRGQACVAVLQHQPPVSQLPDPARAFVRQGQGQGVGLDQVQTCQRGRGEHPVQRIQHIGQSLRFRRAGQAPIDRRNRPSASRCASRCAPSSRTDFGRICPPSKAPRPAPRRAPEAPEPRRRPHPATAGHATEGGGSNPGPARCRSGPPPAPRPAAGDCRQDGCSGGPRSRPPPRPQGQAAPGQRHAGQTQQPASRISDTASESTDPSHRRLRRGCSTCP